MNGQTQHHGRSHMMMADLVVVRLFPKMKVRRYGVFKQVDQKVSDKDDAKRVIAGQPNRLGDNFQKSYREHITRA
jgi:transketolase C-terminal domain/subunit